MDGGGLHGSNGLEVIYVMMIMMMIVELGGTGLIFFGFIGFQRRGDLEKARRVYQNRKIMTMMMMCCLLYIFILNM